jgi:hypothetical protein
MNARHNLTSLALALLMTLALGAGVAQLAEPDHGAARMAHDSATQLA